MKNLNSKIQKMKRVVLMSILLLGWLNGNAQIVTEQNPVWKILFGPKIVYQGDTSLLDKVRVFEISRSKKLEITLTVEYGEKRKTDSEITLSLMDQNGDMVGEFQDVTSNIEYPFSTQELLDFAEMSGIEGDFRMKLTYKDNRFFIEESTLAIFSIKGK